MLDAMLKYCNEHGYMVDGKQIKAEDLVFEERVKLNCFYCGKYNNSWKCPPKVPEIDIAKMFTEFENIAFIYLYMDIDKENYDLVRTESSVGLHKALLLCEQWLWNNNNSTGLSFIGGSCKLCKNGCSPIKCANPYQSRSPVEALGINVVKSAANVGIGITFPPKERMLRIGLLLW